MRKTLGWMVSLLLLASLLCRLIGPGENPALPAVRADVEGALAALHWSNVRVELQPFGQGRLLASCQGPQEKLALHLIRALAGRRGCELLGEAERFPEQEQLQERLDRVLGSNQVILLVASQTASEGWLLVSPTMRGDVRQACGRMLADRLERLRLVEVPALGPVVDPNLYRHCWD